MSLSRSIPNIARYATTSAAPKPKVLVVGAGRLPPLFAAIRQSADFCVGSGGLAVAHQIYNAFKAQGQTLNPGDVSIVDVSSCSPQHWCSRDADKDSPTQITITNQDGPS